MSLLKDWIKQRDQKPGRVFLGLVQRWIACGWSDGLCQDLQAASRLADQVRQRTLQKTYLAVVAGVVVPEGTSLTGSKNHNTNTVRVIESGVPPPSKHSHYERFRSANRCCIQWNGRSHQFGCNWHIVDILPRHPSTVKLVLWDMRSGRINCNSSTQPSAKPSLFNSFAKDQALAILDGLAYSLQSANVGLFPPSLGW